MTLHPHRMSRSEIVSKVLEINPSLRVGNKSPHEMADYLLATIRQSCQAPAFSPEKFVAAFHGMLAELENAFDRDVQRLHQRLRPLHEQRQRAYARLRECLIEFLTATHPGGLSDGAKTVLHEHDWFLETIGAPVSVLHRLVRERSSTLTARGACP